MSYFWQKDNISLRLAQPSDWVYFYENCFNSETRFLYYTETELPADKQSAKVRFARFLKSAQKKGRTDFAIICDGERVVGSLDLYDVDKRNGSFQIASFICEGERGHGYCKKAMQILLDYCFDELRLHKYNARIVSSNTQSITLHSSLGCKKEGVLRDMLYHNGEYLDLEWWGLTAEEYREKFKKA